jgi:hypothetical protein
VGIATDLMVFKSPARLRGTGCTDGGGIKMLIRSLLVITGMLLFSFSVSYGEAPALSGPENLSIRIINPTAKDYWRSRVKFTAKDDLVIEVQGKLCDQKDGISRSSFRRGHLIANNNHGYWSYTAKVFNQGKGYYLIKYEGVDDSAMISELWFFNYSWKAGCYQEKKMHLLDKSQTGWLGESGEDGSSGDLFITKNGSRLLVLPLEKVREMGPENKLVDVIRQKTGTSFELYSTKTLEKLDSGIVSEPIVNKWKNDMRTILVRGVEYESFIDWATAKK